MPMSSARRRPRSRDYARTKAARALVALVIGTEQRPFPRHAPLHCLKRQPFAAAGVSQILSYEGTSEEHREGHAIPGRELRTEPRPVTATASRYVAGAKTADTLLPGSTRTLHVDRPEQPAPQPTSLVPVAGVALSSSGVPALQVVVQFWLQRRPGTSAVTEPDPETVTANGT